MIQPRAGIIFAAAQRLPLKAARRATLACIKPNHNAHSNFAGTVDNECYTFAVASQARPVIQRVQASTDRPHLYNTSMP